LIINRNDLWYQEPLIHLKGGLKLQIIIVANGVLEPEINLALWAKRSDFLIAADGGADRCLAAGVVPDVVIGDLDSISKAALNKLQENDCKIIPYPAEKDFTDLELALRYAVDKGDKEIVVLGALGDRWDMSMANLMLLGADFLKNRTIRMATKNQEIVLLRKGRQISIQGNVGDIVSLLPLGRDANGVTTTGLRYPLDNERLVFAATRGVSNELTSKTATIQLISGLLLCIHKFSSSL
jgi:thiamine pyrophosphokinase